MTILEANSVACPHERHEDVMQRLARGEVAALDELYGTFAANVYNFAWRLCGDHYAAEDVTQETFIAAWYGASRFLGKCSTKTWLLRIAYHRAIDRVRARRPTVPIDDSLENLSCAGADEIEMVATREQIQQALNHLSINHRTVIELTYVHGLSGAEIARVMDCPVKTVRTRMHYAIKHLRRRMMSYAT
jgi:RNA polymerase sigma-70 factor (ECF subfamily)